MIGRAHTLIGSASALSVIAGVAASLTGCFLVTDLDRYKPEQADAGTPDQIDDPALPSSLKLTMIDMGFHFNQLIEYRVVDSQNAIQSLGVIKPLDEPGTVQVTITAPGAIPATNGPYRLDFFADMNASGGFDGIGDLLSNDHSWRVDPLADYPAGKFPHVSNTVEVLFEHNAILTDIGANPPRDTGLGARIHFLSGGLSAWRGRLLQVRVVEQRSGRTVGLYRAPQLPDGDFDAVLPGVLDPGADYNLDIYIDANGNGQYDDPSVLSADTDLGWRIAQQAAPPEPGQGGAGGEGGTSSGAGGAGGAGGGAGAGGSKGSSGAGGAAGGGEEQAPLLFGIDYVFDTQSEPTQPNVDVGPP